jgi:hypothetical protein
MIKKLLFVFIALLFLFLISGSDTEARASSLTSASLTLTNSRMSYKAAVSSGAASSATVTITSGGGDSNTNNLFPGDSVCFSDAGLHGVCRDNKTYTVSGVPSTTTFEVSSNLTTALTATDYVIASESGRWELKFTTTNAVPVSGRLTVTIPKITGSGLGNDGIPDNSSAVSSSGFDINKLAAGDITWASGGCTSANWGTPVVTAGSSTTTTIVWTRASSQCAAASAFDIYIGASGSQLTNQIINPAPITSGHTQGKADAYGITVTTDDGTNTIDSSIVEAAPVEAVLVSATVNPALTFQIAGLSGGTQTYCGSKTYVATNAYSVPWGSQTPGGGFVYAAQQLTVSTNASSGYVVTTQENDQMGRAGSTGTAVTCSSTAPSTGDYTFTGTNYCIRDTVCTVSTCSESTSGDWTSASNYGLGYTEASQTGTAAPFFYNELTRTLSAKQFADIQGGESAQTAMTTTSPVSGDSIYVCYILSLSGSQPAGYYYNYVQYTATATF